MGRTFLFVWMDSLWIEQSLWPLMAPDHYHHFATVVVQQVCQVSHEHIAVWNDFIREVGAQIKIYQCVQKVSDVLL